MRGVLLALASFILYATIAGAIATYAVGRGPSSPASTPPVDERLPTLQAVTVATIVVGITVVDGNCTDYCTATRTVYCTTTTDRISIDWILVPRTDFDALHNQLGCS